MLDLGIPRLCCVLYAVICNYYFDFFHIKFSCTVHDGLEFTKFLPQST